MFNSVYKVALRRNKLQVSHLSKSLLQNKFIDLDHGPKRAWIAIFNCEVKEKA